MEYFQKGARGFCPSAVRILHNEECSMGILPN